VVARVNVPALKEGRVVHARKGRRRDQDQRKDDEGAKEAASGRLRSLELQHIGVTTHV
jgi:hypothetical protein